MTSEDRDILLKKYVPGARNALCFLGLSGWGLRLVYLCIYLPFCFSFRPGSDNGGLLVHAGSECGGGDCRIAAIGLHI